MRTEIFYNDNPVFSGLCPTPLVSREESFVRYGSRWANLETLSLDGLLTGCPNFSEMLARQAVLLEAFSKNYQSFDIQESGQNVFHRDVVFVKEISFPDSKYAYILPFSISLECYPQDFFSGFYGVLEPKNSFDFSQNGDDIVGISHNISAVGFNTSSSSSNALQNAINFCNTHSGLSNIVPPNFISSGGLSNSVLKTVSMNVDRLNSSCSISESWEYDPVLGGTGLLRYNSSFDSGSERGTVQVNLNGTLIGGHNVELPSLRQRFSTLDFYQISNDLYSNFFEGTLNTTELSLSIDEDPFTNSISFSYQFDNDPRPNPYFSDSFSMNLDEINGNKSASLDVTFKYRGNCKCNNLSGWNAIKSYASGFNFYQLAAERNDFYNSGTFLKPSPVSSGISENKEACEIVASVEFEEMDLKLIVPEPLSSFNYTIQVKPAIPQYSAKPTICKGFYSIYDLDFCNRAAFSINGSSVIKPCSNFHSGVAVTKCMIEQIASKVVSGQDVILTSQSFQSGIDPNDRTLSFSYSWTAKIDPVFPSGILYV
jgi:hypothetical protein